VCCSVVAVRLQRGCSVLQCVAVFCSVDVVCHDVSCRAFLKSTQAMCIAAYCSESRSLAVCCSVLQCVAVCCGVLQCILQRDAVCCNMLLCVAVQIRSALSGPGVHLTWYTSDSSVRCLTHVTCYTSDTSHMLYI